MSEPEQRPVPLTIEGLADRLGTSVKALVIGALAVVAACVGGWWALRPPPGPDVETILPMVGETPMSPALPADSPRTIRVHVAGAVAEPDVYELNDGDRVIDAVAAAGGFADDADESRLNLAEPLADGARLWVPALGQTDEPDVVHPTLRPEATTDPLRIDVNDADAAALESLPGIGPALAAAIVEYRERVGSFSTLDDLDAVAGIGPATIERLRPFAYV